MPRGKKKIVEETAVQPIEGEVAEEVVEEKKPARKPGRPRKVKPAEEPAFGEVAVEETAVGEAAADMPAPKAHKAYPGHEERIAMADKQIDRLAKLNASREALIALTEEKLAARKAALEKSASALEKVVAKKARIIASKEKSAMSAAERSIAQKAAKAEEKLKMSKIMEALKASGKSLDDLLEEIKEKI